MLLLISYLLPTGNRIAFGRKRTKLAELNQNVIRHASAHRSRIVLDSKSESSRDGGEIRLLGAITKTGAAIVASKGEWCIIRKEGRFPFVEGAIPRGVKLVIPQNCFSILRYHIAINASLPSSILARIAKPSARYAASPVRPTTPLKRTVASSSFPFGTFPFTSITKCVVFLVPNAESSSKPFLGATANARKQSSSVNFLRTGLGV